MRKKNISYKTILLFFFVYTIALATSTTEELKIDIKHANTYYWLGIEENGNMAAFHTGLEYLDSADSLISKINNDSVANIYSEQIKHLRKDIRKQANMAYDTFFGFFPLVRFFTGSNIFTDPGVYNTFEFIDDPDIIVVTHKVKTFTDNIISTWKKSAQLDVIVISEPQNTDYENELRYLLSKNNRFFVHNEYEISAILSNSEIFELRKDTLSGHMRKKICGLINNNLFLIIDIKQKDIVDDIYFYQLEGKIFSKESKSRLNYFRTNSFTRERSSSLKAIVNIHILFFLFSFLIFIFFDRFLTQDKKLPSFIEILTIPTLAFFLGRFAIWFFVPMLASFMPEAETLAILSFWWVIALGILIYIAPVLLLKILISKFKGSLSKLFIGRLGIVLLISGLGVNASIALPILLYGEFYNYLHIFLLTLSSSISLLVIGNSIDDTNHDFTLSLALWGSINLGVIALFIFSVHPEFLWINLFISFFLISYPKWYRIIIKFLAKNNKKAEEQIKKKSEDVPKTLEELIKKTNSPNYFETDIFEKKIWSEVEKVFSIEPHNNCIILVGDSGSGKTETANQIIKKLISQSKLNPDQVIRGICKENEEVPYSAFAKPLDKFINFNILSPPQDQLNHIDSGIEELVNSFVPFISLIGSNNENDINPAESKEHIQNKISHLISSLSKKRKLVIFIDDIQWMDSASKELLLFLLSQHKSNEKGNILFILTSRNSKIKDLNENILPIELSKDEKIGILEKNGLSKSVSLSIVNHLEIKGNHKSSNGNLHWIFRIVRELVNRDYLKQSEKGFIWSKTFNKDELPIPEDYISSIKEIINNNLEYSEILECAACIGNTFSVSLVDYCLNNLGRLKTIKSLREIEVKTGLICDDMENDDLYTFQSSYTLEAIRNVYNIHPLRTKNTEQLILEFHSRIAKYLEDIEGDIYEIANHYYLSGTRNVVKAIEFLLKASNKARNVFEYDNARIYINRTSELVNESGLSEKYELDILIEKCHIAHNEMKAYSKEVAKDILIYLEKEKEPSFKNLLIFIRTLFDGGKEGFPNNNREIIIEYTNKIINNSSDSREVAEAKQFKALVIIDFSDSEEKNIDKQKKEHEDLLENAIELLENKNDIETFKLKARIFDSLGRNFLSQMNSKKQSIDEFFGKQKEAIKYFKKSISLKERDDINDLTGQTMSYGGLGDAYLKGSSKNIEDIKMAIKYFKIDFVISEKINQAYGMTVANSKLGECYYLIGEYKKSNDFYALSYKYADNNMGKYFAQVGLMKTSIKLGKEYEAHISEILSIFEKDKLLEEKDQFDKNSKNKDKFIEEIKNLEINLTTNLRLKIEALVNDISN